MRLAYRQLHASRSQPAPTGEARSRRPAAAATVAALTILLSAACISAHPTAASVTTHEPALPAPPSPPAASPLVTGGTGPTDAAVAAYRAFWDDAAYANAHAGYWNAAVRTSLGVGGSLSNLFSRHASGTAYQQQILSIYRADKNGEFSEGRPTLHPVVLDTTSSLVRLTDCLDATKWLVHLRPSGQLKNATPGQRHPLEATVVNLASGWHVRDLKEPTSRLTC